MISDLSVCHTGTIKAVIPAQALLYETTMGSRAEWCDLLRGPKQTSRKCVKKCYRLQVQYTLLGRLEGEGRGTPGWGEVCSILIRVVVNTENAWTYSRSPGLQHQATTQVFPVGNHMVLSVLVHGAQPMMLILLRLCKGCDSCNFGVNTQRIMLPCPCIPGAFIIVDRFLS